MHRSRNKRRHERAFLSELWPWHITAHLRKFCFSSPGAWPPGSRNPSAWGRNTSIRKQGQSSVSWRLSLPLGSLGWPSCWINGQRPHWFIPAPGEKLGCWYNMENYPQNQGTLKQSTKAGAAGTEILQEKKLRVTPFHPHLVEELEK